MVGRAGRPQFDTHATAVIMTRHETCRKYETFLSGLQTVESYLHQNLIEHLNAEVVLGTIEEVTVALKWIKSTFLYVRVRRNPSHYLGGENTELSEDYLDRKLQEMCLKDLELLNETELIRLSSNSRFISPTPLGRLMARFCLSYPTMKKLISLNFDSPNLGDTLLHISELQEFDDVKLRMSEKKVLNSLNRDKQRATIRHPMKGKIKSTAMKVNCLIQSTLGCLSFQDFTLSQDVQRIFRSAYRVSRCLLEIQLLREDFTAIHHTASLHQCINSKLWMDSHYVSKQLERVGPTISNSLVQAGLISFKKILETNPRQLELIANRHPPFGTHLINSVSSLPNYSLSVEQRMPIGIDVATIDIVLRLNNSLDLVNTNKKSQPTHSSLLLVGDSNDRRLFAKYRITDSYVMQKSDRNVSYCIKVPNSTEHNVSLKIILKSLKFVGLDINQTFTPKYLAPIKRHSTQKQQQQQQQRNIDNNNVSHQNSPRTGQNFDLGQSYYTDSSPINQYLPNSSCSHRCFDKLLCGHACCKNGLSNVSRVPNKPNRDLSSHYVASRSSVMSSFLEEVNTKQGLLPSPGFSLRLKQTVSAIKEYSYNPPSTYEYPATQSIYAHNPSILDKPPCHSTNFVAQESYQAQGQHLQNKKTDFENDFDIFADDLPIDDIIYENTLQQQDVLKSIENSAQYVSSRAQYAPYGVVEPMQKSIQDFEKINSENDKESFRSKRFKSLNSENSFQPFKQPEHFNNYRSKHSNTIPDKFNLSKPSFFLSQIELESVNSCEQEDYCDFFEQ